MHLRLETQVVPDGAHFDEVVIVLTTSEDRLGESAIMGVRNLQRETFLVLRYQGMDDPEPHLEMVPLADLLSNWVTQYRMTNELPT